MTPGDRLAAPPETGSADVPDYYVLLGMIHAHLKPTTYLEIGVHQGHSLRFSGPGTVALGIDPAADPRFPLSSCTKLFRLTSDRFFAETDVGAELGGRPVDLAFLDGLHLFEQTLADFADVERYCTSDSVVLVHDCLPIDEVTSSRERSTVLWTGDVWKLVVCLGRYRPDLAVATVDVPPSGLAVVTNLDSRSTVLRDRFDALCSEFVPLAYGDLLAMGRDRVLNRVPSDWDAVRRALSGATGGSRVEAPSGRGRSHAGRAGGPDSASRAAGGTGGLRPGE